MKSGHADDVGLVEVPELDVAVREVVQPRQLAPVELLRVEHLVHLDGALQLLRDVEGGDAGLADGPRALLQHPHKVIDADL